MARSFCEMKYVNEQIDETLLRFWSEDTIQKNLGMLASLATQIRKLLADR